MRRKFMWRVSVKCFKMRVICEAPLNCRVWNTNMFSLTILFKPLFTSTLIWELPTTTTAFKKKDFSAKTTFLWRRCSNVTSSWLTQLIRPSNICIKEKLSDHTQFFCHILDFHLAITIKNSKKFHPLRLYFLKMEKIHHSRNTDKSSWLITVLER